MTRSEETGGAERAVRPAPMPRDERGWRVAPAPDGRGMPDEHKPRPPHRLRGFWVFVIALLAVNWISLLAFSPPGQPRVRVPFSPYFVEHVQAGGQVDLLPRRHHPGHLCGQGAVSDQRPQSRPDDAVLHGGSALLEQCAADRLAAVQERPGQRPGHVVGHLAAG